MRIALMVPRTQSETTRLAFFRLAGELAGAGAECLLFTEGGEEEGAEKYAAFYVAWARQLVPVTVFLRKQTDKLQIFFVSAPGREQPNMSTKKNGWKNFLPCYPKTATGWLLPLSANFSTAGRPRG